MALMKMGPALLLFAVACFLPGPAAAQLPTEADILVVGAGMAGVTAAALLQQSNVSVILLEGRNRPGGRLQSTSVQGGGRIDLGAMWIHDAVPGNTLYEQVMELGLPLSPRINYNSIAQYTPEGLPSNDTASRQVSFTFVTEVLAGIQMIRSSGATQDQSLGEYYASWLARQNFTDHHQVWQVNSLMHGNWQTLLNANASELSLLRFGDAKLIPAVDVTLRDGFDSVVDALIEEAGGLDIRYNTVVWRVSHSNDSCVVHTADGGRYVARACIVTASLGMLKNDSIAFEPELPPYKQQAIRDMGFGVLDKTVLVFEQPFWAPADFIAREMPDLSGRWSLFLNYQKVLQIPALVALHVADTARSLEALSDAEVVAEAMEVLRSIYQRNGTTVPDPIQYNVTRWAADPFALGSYSYFAVGNPKNITDALAQPVGCLLFAGEATSNRPASVLGAYLSGLREAERVLGLLKELETST